LNDKCINDSNFNFHIINSYFMYVTLVNTVLLETMKVG